MIQTVTPYPIALMSDEPAKQFCLVERGFQGVGAAFDRFPSRFLDGCDEAFDQE